MSEHKTTLTEGFVDGDLLLDDIKDLGLEEETTTDSGEERGTQPPTGSDTTQDDDIEDQGSSSKEDDVGDDLDIIDDEDADASASTDEDPKGKEPDSDDEPEGNDMYLLGVTWKEKGLIPDDAKLDPNMSGEDLEKLYRESNNDRIARELETKYADRLKAKGIDPDEILRSDDDVVLRVIDSYRQLGDLTYDDLVEKSNDASNSIKLMAKEYYTSKSPDLSDEEIEGLVTADLDKNTDEESFMKYQKFFVNEADSMESRYQASVKEREKSEAKQNQSNAERVRSSLKEANIGGRQLTDDEIKQVVDGMYKKDQIYDNGKIRKRVSLFEKKRLEAGDDVNKQLALAVHLILGIDAESIKDQSERVGKRSLLDKLAKAGGISNSSAKGKETDDKSNPGDDLDDLKDYFLDM